MASSGAQASAAAGAASSSSPSSSGGGLVPAQLGFLAIFNPSLGTTDDTIDDQIVYYASVTTQASPHKRRRTRGRPTDAISQDERHERLRQIGLAQGMANFSRGFAEGAAVDAIDTETSRVVMHELEPGWWILASIDLTKVPLPPRLPTKAGQSREDKFECTTREMKPTSLLLRDLLRAHEIFLMHHDSSLSALFVHSRRSKFVALLNRYWDLFLSTWSVMLHGNPARDIFGGINVAASGELGVGVGEEDRGSGERDVLEGLVGRIEGLVDLVVSKFGKTPDKKHEEHEPWLGTGREPAAVDGAIFLGTGALSRKSLRDVTHWMEDLYTWGEHAYGLIESPTSIRHAKARKAAKSAEQDPKPATAAEAAPSSSGGAKPTASQLKPESEGGAGDDSESHINKGGAGQAKTKDVDDGKLDKMLSYMKLGYGSYWTLPGSSGDSSPSTQPRIPEAGAEAVRERSPETPREPPAASGAGPRGPTASHEASGHFLIGLRGEIEESQEADAGLSQTSASGESDAENNSRTVVRTLHVELESGATGQRPEATVVKDFAHPASVHTQSQVMGNMLPGYNLHDLNKAHKLRVVVYVNRPFVFVFLFRLRTDSLAWDALYRSLHYQLAPLKRPLLASTSYRPDRPGLERASSSIYNLVWDPSSLTVHSIIPCIQDLTVAAAAGDSWSRADAVSTHLHLLNIHAATRSLAGDVERTQKTSRGWWIVWTRLLDRCHHDSPRAGSTGGEKDEDEEVEGGGALRASTSSLSLGSASDRHTAAGGGGDDNDARALAKEIFLVRRASDHAGLLGGAGGGGESRLAQGIGVDTRRYVEELLSLL
ncbi:putative Vacuolar fusion protein CCZ1 [Hirsutella rhossiliensis]|uniref:Vacuolar fusion protein CCZ1 n=1 Tax=Hirsutella rhossiliensis TaxID=111463 RepID=A0A9P8SEG8_9HYPO|nr:putative Vacuolar fusion protein CCZ1 [Hirsutella rhossiliensis]KAH0959656.1 putative Vacuolar fusion protein CCZ1 [Hirsutella rhossiliensis]